MWVYSCFEGDEDKALAGVQHDAYFATPRLPSVSIERRSTLGWLWYQVMRYCEGRHSDIAWVRRNLPRLRAVGGFNHKLLQTHHEHIAAYFRWTMPRVVRDCVLPDDAEQYPFELLYAWHAFLMRDIPAWLEAPEPALAIARRVLLQSFEEGDEAADELHRLLFERYRYECVSKTWWAAEKAQRLMPGRFPAATGREPTERTKGRLVEDASGVGSRVH
jgi:hypothetical protein